MNSNKIILLSGTPASGKDTITSELIKINSRYVHFKKHKIAAGGKLDETYYLIEKNEFDSMVVNDDFIQYHYRYDRGYGVSKKELKLIFGEGKNPIIHVGKYENISPFIDYDNVSLISVLLLVSKEETSRRLQIRHSNNDVECLTRMHAYEEERDELANLIRGGAKLNFDLIINNTKNSAQESALKINHFIV